MVWLFGIVFLISGIVMTACGGSMAYSDLQWNGSVTANGVVILTEWRNQNNENHMNITYGYKDETGSIYHNTAVLARRYGKINLQPGAPVVVLYRPEDHTKSRLSMESNPRDWAPLLFLGVVEIVVGGLFVGQSVRSRMNV
jgi:hypothetical protein